MNPLYEFRFPIPWNDILPEHVRPALEHHVALARRRLNALRHAPRTPDIVARIDQIVSEPLHVSGVVQLLRERTSRFDAAGSEIDRAFDGVIDFIDETRKDGALERALLDVQGEAALGPGEARRLARTLGAFRRSGARLQGRHRARLHKLEAELASRESRFFAKEAQLEATDADVGSIAAEPDRKVREAEWRAMRCRPVSEDDVEGILALRNERARLLGFENAFECATHERDIGDAVAVSDALQADLALRATANREHCALAELAGARGLDGPLMPWDVHFYQDLADHQRDATAGELSRYLDRERVMPVLCELVSSIFGVTVRRAPNTPVWDVSVIAYDVAGADGSSLGTFFLDLFASEGGEGGWSSSPITLHTAGRAFALSGDLGATASADLSPMTLITICGGFGAALHHFLVEAPPVLLTARGRGDGHELGFLLLGDLCARPEVLASFTRHPETGARAPGAMLDAFHGSLGLRATWLMHALGAARVERSLQSGYTRASDGPPSAHLRDVFEDSLPLPFPHEYTGPQLLDAVVRTPTAEALEIWTLFSAASVLPPGGLATAAAKENFRRALIDGRAGALDAAAVLAQVPGLGP